jgi:hypothetical protein
MADFDQDFEEFWRVFPRKVGKLAARASYVKVRRGGITRDELLDGVSQYIATKPQFQEFCHPKTWLNQGRWMDEAPAQPQQTTAAASPMTTRLGLALANIKREAR